MKKTIISLASLAALFLLMPACTPNAPSEDDLFINPDNIKEITKGGTVYNINDFLAKFMTEEGNFASDTCPYRTRSFYMGLYLFSVDTLPTNGPDIYLRGRVVTDDYGGNFYKAIVIQQTTDWNTGLPLVDENGKPDQQALRISIDMGSASGLFHQGQEILIRCNGLGIGRYANEPQLCVPSYNNNVYASSSYNQKVGWAPGRIPSPRFRKACQLLGKPDISKLVYDTLTMEEVYDKYLSKCKDVEAARLSDGRAVLIKDVFFTGQYKTQQGEQEDCNPYNPKNPDTKGNPEEDEYACVFGPTTRNVGYPQSRFVSSDGSNKLSILVSTSEYAKYAYYYLPDKKYVGSVKGILGYYMDNSRYAPSSTDTKWSITPNNLSDILPERQADKDPDNRWTPVEWEFGVPQPGTEDTEDTDNSNQD